MSTSQPSPTLQTRLRDRLERAPERPALAFADPAGVYRWRSFAEVYADAAGYGAALAERGLERDRVCVLALPSDELCGQLLLGALLIGARPLLVAPPVVRGLQSQLAETLAEVLTATDAALFIGDEGFAPLAEDLARASPDTRLLFGAGTITAAEADSAPQARPRADDVALLQLTSGTTGRPRICVWEQHAVDAALVGMKHAMQLGPDDRCLNWTPLYHDMGLVNNFLLCLVEGVPLAMLGTLDFLKKPARWLQGLTATGATMTWSPNFGFALAAQRIRDTDLDGVSLDGVRAFWNAAERIHLETLEAFLGRFARLGVRREAMRTNFGCAENVGGATFSDDGWLSERLDAQALFDEGIAELAEPDGADHIDVVGVGRPHPGMSIRILSPDGESLPDGRVGEVALDTPSRMRGYLGAPEATHEALDNGLLRTGDLGYLRDGELFWVGRVRERINLRGRKYDPSDFERALLETLGLREGCFAAFGVDDPELGTQRLVIVTEVRDTNERPLHELLAGVREQVLLRVGVHVDEVLLLPQAAMAKTSSGKRRHRFYRREYLEGRLQPLTRLG